MKTNTEPATTPGIDNGNVTFLKAVQPGAYRSRAASTNRQSIRSRAA
jgi:hypothetical protein